MPLSPSHPPLSPALKKAAASIAATLQSVDPMERGFVLSEVASELGRQGQGYTACLFRHIGYLYNHSKMPNG